MPAATDIAIDLLPRLEGYDHMIGLGIFRVFGFGPRYRTEGGQYGQRTNEKTFHTIGLLK